MKGLLFDSLTNPGTNFTKKQIFRSPLLLCICRPRAHRSALPAKLFPVTVSVAVRRVKDGSEAIRGDELGSYRLTPLELHLETS